jgi:hypothetical protein
MKAVLSSLSRNWDMLSAGPSMDYPSFSELPMRNARTYNSQMSAHMIVGVSMAAMSVWSGNALWQPVVGDNMTVDVEWEAGK